MTTIAVNREMMAADSQASTDSVKTAVQKIWKVRGWYIGVAGNYSEAVDAIDLIKRDRTRSPFDIVREDSLKLKGVNLLFLSPSGGVYESEDGCTPQKLTEGFGAAGTGSQGAMVALMLGHTPTEAVRACTKVDPNTGGRVITRKLK